MSENQYLEIIENKIDGLAQAIEQQTKSGVFFDGFTKQVLENISTKLDTISDFESNELISYLKGELRKAIEDRHNVIQSRLEGVQSQITTVQANLNDSLKSPEMVTVFTRLSDSILEFSRDLNSQTKYFNSAVEGIQTELSRMDLSNKFDYHSSRIQSEVSDYRTSMENFSYDINASFESVKKLIESTSGSEAFVALSGDISVLQKGLNDVINAVLAMNTKQSEIITNISTLSANSDVQDIRLDVSSLLAEIQALKDSVRILVNKSDIEAINEKLGSAIEMISSFKNDAASQEEENKFKLNNYFTDLNAVITNLVSKEESNFITNKLEAIQAGFESGQQNIREIFEQNNNELRNIIPLISSLSTKDNIRELSEGAINSINQLTAKWSENVAQNAYLLDEKFNVFQSALSNIHDVLSNVVSKVEKDNSSDILIVKEEINTIVSYINNAKEQIAMAMRGSIDGFSDNLNNTQRIIEEKISNLEGVLNNSSEGLRGLFNACLDELRAFSQNFAEIINQIYGKVDAKTEEIKGLVNERYENFVFRLEQLTNEYSTFNIEQKVEILNSLEILRQVVEATKTAIDNDTTYQALNEKIVAFENILSENKNTILSSNEQVLYAMSVQNNLFETINSSVKDLQISLSNVQEVSSSDKTEILNDIAQKVYTITSLINEAKYQINNDITTNKESLVGELGQIKTIIDEVKESLNLVNENQISKQFFNEIFEVTGTKLNQLSNVLTETKDFNLTQYDGIKGLFNDLKEGINGVVILLSQSSDFAQNMFDRISVGFSDLSGKLNANVELLKNELANVSADQKFSIISQIEQLSSKVEAVQASFAGLNFDESVKSQLIDLKNQIEAFSHQSLVDILNKVTENNEQASQKVIETVGDIKSNFESVLNQIQNVQTVSYTLKSDLQQAFLDGLNDLEQKIETFVKDLETNSVSNKEQILAEIANLQTASSDLNYNIQNISESMLKDTFILEQTEKINKEITIFSQNVERRLDDINNTDKGYVLEAVKTAVSELQQNVVESINYLKSLNLNLDRSLTGSKNTILESIGEVKEVSVKAIDILNESKSEILTNIGEVTNKIEEKIVETQTKAEVAKESLLTQLSGAFSQNVVGLKADFESKLRESLDLLGEKISVLTNGLHNNAEKNKEHVVDVIEQAKEKADNIKEEMSSLILSSKEEIKEVVSSDVISSASANKTELLGAITTLSEVLNEIQSNTNQIAGSGVDTKIVLLGEQLEKIKTGLVFVGTQNKEEILAKTQTVIEELNQVKEDIEKVLSTDFVNVLETNKTELLSATQTISSVLSEIKMNLQQIAETDLVFGLQKLEDKIGNVDKEINSNVEGSKKEILTLVGSVTEVLSEIKSEIEQVKSFDFAQDFETVEIKLDEIKNSFTATSVKNKEEIISFVENLFNIVNNLKGELQTNLKEQIDAASNVVLTTFSDRIGIFSIKIGEILSSLQQLLVDNDEELISKFQEISSQNKNELMSVMDNLKTETELISKDLSVIEEKICENNQKSQELSSEIKQILGTSLASVTETLTKDSSAGEEFRENLKYELKKAIDEITNKIIKLDEDNSTMKEELLYDLQKTFNILSQKADMQCEKTDNLQEKLENNIQENIKNVEITLQSAYKESNTELIRELTQEINLEELKTDFSKDVVERLEKTQNNLQEDLKNVEITLQSAYKESNTELIRKLTQEINLEELKTGFSNDISEKVEKLTAHLEELSKEISATEMAIESGSKLNKNEILTQLALVKDELLKSKSEESYTGVLETVKALEEKLQGISDDILDALSNDLDASFTDNIKLITEAIEDKISYVKDDIQEIIIKVSNFDSVVDSVKNIVCEYFEEYFASNEEQVKAFSEEIKKHVDNNTENIIEKLNSYQKEIQALADIDLSAYSEGTKQFVKTQISELAEKMAELNKTTSLEVSLHTLSDSFETSAEDINKKLVALRDIILAEMPSGEEISDNFDEIKTALNDISFKTKGIEAVVKDENASLKEVIERYQEGLSALAGLDAVSEKEETKIFIKDELKNLKEQFIRSLATVFENVSFIEESEEIQNVIFDNADEIKNEINKLKKDLVDYTNSNDDIDEKINNLKLILESITTGSASSSGKYTYTLPDVETDIAKMRMAISDITEILKRSQEDENGVAERLDSIDDIRDDISSISKRTNKLILTSEDANNHLKSNIAEFKKIIEEINEKCNRFDNTNVQRNLEDVKALVMSGLRSDKILNEAFMHLAEWIDDSAKTMNSIASQAGDNKDELKEIKHDLARLEDKTDEITKVKEAVVELTTKFERKFDTDYSKFLYDIECGLDKISDKLEVQELKIKSLEKKLDNISNSPVGGEEVASILEFIASQASAANENSRSNKLLLQKIEMMEKQMNQFENSISKITAFIDGVN